eukprot:299440-Prorocentrum_minimum.AAC.3
MGSDKKRKKSKSSKNKKHNFALVIRDVLYPTSTDEIKARELVRLLLLLGIRLGDELGPPSAPSRKEGKVQARSHIQNIHLLYSPVCRLSRFTTDHHRFLFRGCPFLEQRIAAIDSYGSLNYMTSILETSSGCPKELVNIVPKAGFTPHWQARKIGKKLKTAEVAGYTNEENPFGDANLTERFVWHKKLEKQIASGVDVKELGIKAEKKKHEQRLAEIERVKKRREDRATEKEQLEADKELMNRERAIAEAVELERKEEEVRDWAVCSLNLW